HDIVRFGTRPHPHSFVSGNSHENFPVGHPSWDYSHANSLNFEVPMEPEASELIKGLMLGKDGHVHIRHITPYLLIDMGCYNPPPQGLDNFLVGHPSWDFSRTNSLNFRVPMESEASELPKGLVLRRDGHVHIRTSPPLRWSMWDVTMNVRIRLR
ncbi:hypothetical protein DVH24_034086, partial [Malus domestica]